MARAPFASFPARIASALIDGYVLLMPGGILNDDNHRSVGVPLVLAGLAWSVLNAYLAGTTGQSIGKRALGTKLVRASDGQVLGGGLAVLRFFLHLLDSIPLGLGYVRAAWDPLGRTFADSLVGSAVVRNDPLTSTL